MQTKLKSGGKKPFPAKGSLAHSPRTGWKKGKQRRYAKCGQNIPYAIPGRRLRQGPLTAA